MRNGHARRKHRARSERRELEPTERTLLTAADELYRDSSISDATWKDLSSRLDQVMVVNALISAANYRQVSMGLNALGGNWIRRRAVPEHRGQVDGARGRRTGASGRATPRWRAQGFGRPQKMNVPRSVDVDDVGRAVPVQVHRQHVGSDAGPVVQSIRHELGAARRRGVPDRAIPVEHRRSVGIRVEERIRVGPALAHDEVLDAVAVHGRRGGRMDCEKVTPPAFVVP